MLFGSNFALELLESCSLMLFGSNFALELLESCSLIIRELLSNARLLSNFAFV